MTKKELAKACGVSRMTLDRVLNDQPGVSIQKREEIKTFIKKHGYRKNALAQSLNHGSSKSFGLIVFDLNNSFYAQLINAFQTTAQESDFVSYIMLSNKDPKCEIQLIEALLERQVDGILLNSAVSDSGYGSYLQSQKVPILSVMNRIDSQVPFLGFDERSSMKELMNHAIQSGYRRFYYVCPPLARAKSINMDSLLCRKQGYDEVIKENPMVQSLTISSDDYVARLKDIDYSASHRPCIICTSDVYAVEIHKTLHENGLRTPKDYALAGYDNIPLIHSFFPKITTVSLNINQLGAMAARLLVSSSKGEQLPRETIMSHTLLKMDTL